ncbi:ABC transporter substrate-binding protein [Variovorax paradoxus]|uniref:ABC transporter substrate-binding protein n=1 Tax=Variovorax paradoxus TaxID=34073 RepID=UPI0021AC9E16|nr:ABC transporter substrate-binding protein [Variovorax paradoxus]UVH57532.1 ABC transporter substrate-binding protein [Variovorax paradoxus]
MNYRSICKSIPLVLSAAVIATASFNAAAFQQPGKITAGSDLTFFPYEYMDNNQPAGFDVEFLDGLAKIMGRKAENIDTRFPNLITGLQGGRFDIINSSMYITAERVKVMDMIPYLKSGESILALKGAEYQPKKPEDFCGHKIGSMGATSWLQQMRKLSTEYCVKNGKKPIEISEYGTDPQTTQALLSKAVEAQITDAAVARGAIEKLGDRISISSDTLIYPVLNGFGVKKGNDEVKKALIDALNKYKVTPEYAALLKKYKFEPPAEKDLQELMPKP